MTHYEVYDETEGILHVKKKRFFQLFFFKVNTNSFFSFFFHHHPRRTSELRYMTHYGVYDETEGILNAKELFFQFFPRSTQTR